MSPKYLTMKNVIKLAVVLNLLFSTNAYGLSTGVNQAIKNSIDPVTGNFLRIRFADGTIQTTAGNGGGTWGSITGTLSNQTDLNNALNNKVGSNTTISTTSPLSGGGDLSANRTLSITQASGAQPGYLSNTDWNTFNSKVSGLNGSSTGQVLTNPTLSGVTTLQNHGGWTYGSSTTDTYQADRGIEYASGATITTKYGSNPAFRSLKMVCLAAAGMGTSTDPAWTGVVTNGSATLGQQQTVRFTYTIPAGEFGPWDQITIKGYATTYNAQVNSIRQMWYIDDVPTAIGTKSASSGQMTSSDEVTFMGVGKTSEINYTNPTVSTSAGGTMYVSNYALMINKSLNLTQAHTIRVDLTAGTTSVGIHGFTVKHLKLVEY